MVKIFVYQIRCGKMTVDDVPTKWREEVRKEVEKNG
ncbi:MAG: CD1375 family protein [Oscillospiraceae bacterium]|nr:CD1375 family protein [Oscillospiraceae bacterium]